MERGFVSWLSGWIVSSSSWSLSLGWLLFSACVFGLWDGGEGEGEGEQEAVWGGLATAPSIFIFTAAFSFSFSFSLSLSFLSLECESSNASSSSGGHEDGRGPRLAIPCGKLDFR